MKISLDDLEKVLKWIRANSKDQFAIFKVDDGKLTIQVKDNYESYAEITIFSESNMMPKIKKESIL